jgi:Skp family chaperone for outer membrane proteins
MKFKQTRIVLALAAILSVGALAQTGAAATPAPSVPAPTAAAPKIGIINMQQAILASNEGRRDFESLQKKFEPKQTELKGMNDEVEGLKKQLNTQGDKLNDEARANLVKTIESKQKSLQRSLEDAQGDFQSQQNDILNRVGQKMMEVLDKYAKDNGYTMILDVSNPQSPVLWAGASSDVTKAIVDAYNTQSGVAAPAATSRPSASAKPAIGTKPASATSKPATTPPASTTPH